MRKQLRRIWQFIKEKLLNSRLQTKLSVLVLMAVFVPLLVSTQLFNNFSEENLLQVQRQNARNAYALLVDLFATRIENVNQNIALLFQDTNVRMLLQSPLAEQDSQKLPNYKALMNTTFDYVLNKQSWEMKLRVYVPPERSILIDNKRIFPDSLIRHMAWYQETVSKPYKKNWVFNGEDAASLTDSPFSCVVRVCDPNSILSTLSVIRFDFSAEQIRQTMEQSLVGGGCGAFLVTREEEIIVGASDFSSDEIVGRIVDTAVGQYGQWTELREGRERYEVCAEWIQGTPWRLVYAYRVMDTKTALFNNMQWVVIIFWSLCMGLVVTGMALFMMRRITGQIGTVSDGMIALKDGELKPLPPSRSKDEIGMLIDSYNYLSDELTMLKNAQMMAVSNQRHAEAIALRAQINPHFLYNSLEMINYFAMVGDADKVERIVILLSRFYKRCLNYGSEYTTVRDELELIRFYCEIQDIRHEGRLHFDFNVPTELMMYRIPHLILQPLVENAIHHGIDKKEEQSGTIRIDGELRDGMLYITISDDGMGMTEERLKQLREGLEEPKANEESGSHYALRNINTRLISLYGPSAGLSYQSVLGQGTAVTITLEACVVKRGMMK